MDDETRLGVTNRNPELDQILEKRQAYLSHTLDQSSILATLEMIWSDWQKQELREAKFDPISPEDAVSTILTRIQN